MPYAMEALGNKMAEANQCQQMQNSSHGGINTDPSVSSDLVLITEGTQRSWSHDTKP